MTALADVGRFALLARVGLLGLATGSRSSAASAALAYSSSAGDPAPLGLLASSRGRTIAGLAAFGELVADKLPRTPSRLTVGPLGARVCLGACAGVGLAVRAAAVPVRELPMGLALPAAAVGGASAFAGAHLGAAWRSSAPFTRDLPAALIEDVTAVALGWASTYR